MSYWAEVVGQSDAVATLSRAADPATGERSHAWLITGPPGSGRITVARRFAAALVAEGTDDASREEAFTLVNAGTHPDVSIVSTQASQLDVKMMREAVAASYYAPSESALRVIVVEDADRMNQQSANATLKALEEPPVTTVWVLCAPSVADVLPTIRSRTRSVQLRTPTIAEVAELLSLRDDVPSELAQQTARLTQGHIGMARRIATDPEALARRNRTVEAVLEVASLSDAMRVANELHKIAQADSSAMFDVQENREREDLRRRLGLGPDERIPPKLNSQFKELDADLKRRKTRLERDGIDRVLVDLLTVARDLLMIKLDAGQPLTNAEHESELRRAAELMTIGGALDMAAGLDDARLRLARNVSPALVLEAALCRQIVAQGKKESELIK